MHLDPLTAGGNDVRVALNVTGLSDEGQLTVEVLDERFVPLPGYSAADFVPIEQSLVCACPSRGVAEQPSAN